MARSKQCRISENGSQCENMTTRGDGLCQRCIKLIWANKQQKRNIENAQRNKYSKYGKKTEVKKTEVKKKRQKLEEMSFSKVKDIADTLFSKKVRQSRAVDGICKCVTCGRLMQAFGTGNCHAGHFIGRQFYLFRYSLENVWPQCYNCNSNNEGMKDKYSQFLDYTFGDGYAEKMRLKVSLNQNYKPSKFGLIIMIKDLKDWLKENK